MNVDATGRYRADRRIEILRSQTWYVTGDSPDLQKVARGWEAKLADALGRGYEGLRVAASAPELEEKQWADFFDYEERLNHYLSDKAMLVLCAYSLAAPRAADERVLIRRPSGRDASDGRCTRNRTSPSNESAGQKPAAFVRCASLRGLEIRWNASGASGFPEAPDDAARAVRQRLGVASATGGVLPHVEPSTNCGVTMYTHS